MLRATSRWSLRARCQSARWERCCINARSALNSAHSTVHTPRMGGMRADRGENEIVADRRARAPFMEAIRLGDDDGRNIEIRVGLRQCLHKRPAQRTERRPTLTTTAATVAAAPSPSCPTYASLRLRPTSRPLSATRRFTGEHAERGGAVKQLTVVAKADAVANHSANVINSA